MLKYNSYTLEVGQIKQTLLSFNLPNCRVWKSGMIVFEGCHYVTSRYIVYAKKTGIPKNEDDGEYFIKSLDYKLNKQVLNYTKKYELNSIYYDNYTHTYLGDYLRFKRDYEGIDLMRMYNCFVPKEVSNILFGRQSTEKDLYVYAQSSQGDSQVFADKSPAEKTLIKTYATDISLKESNSDSCRIYEVPIKFFNKYTIAVDCDSKIEFIVDFYDNGKQITFGNDYVMDAFFHKTYTSKINSLFSSSFVYSGVYDIQKLVDSMVQYESKVLGSGDLQEEKNKLMKQLYMREKTMKLLIRVPSSCKSSIVILEGDYTTSSQRRFDDSGNVIISNLPLTYTPEKNIPKVEYNSSYDYSDKCDRGNYPSKIQLLNMNYSEHFAVSDRLIEFLSGNVIGKDDYISNNVENIQKRLFFAKPSGYSNRLLSEIKYKGKWTDELRDVIYDNMCASISNSPEDIKKSIINTNYDITGYVDCDTEEKINEYDLPINKTDKGKYITLNGGIKYYGK